MVFKKGDIPANKGKKMSPEQYEQIKHTFFPKGHVPANKGQKMSAEVYAKCAPTMFKKGHASANRKPIGSERIDAKDGYVLVKVKEPNVWRLKQRVIWEEAYGPIPKGNVLIFIDGDRTNCNIDNLMMITRAQHSVLNNLNLRVRTREPLETALLIVKLVKEKRTKINRKRKAK